MKKRLLSALLVLYMVLSLLPGEAWAEVAPEDEPEPVEITEGQADDSVAPANSHNYEELEDNSTFDGSVNFEETIPLSDVLTYGYLSYGEQYHQRQRQRHPRS